jgi:hypothetical protein
MPYIVRYQELYTLNKGDIIPTENWNHCDVCDIQLEMFHYTILTKTETTWICSEKCANMWIFQNI